MMNHSHKKVFLSIQGLGMAGLLLMAPTAQAFVNPSSILIKIYEVRVSPNTSCTSSVRIMSNASGVVTDFASNPSLGSGAVPNGNYQCVMVKLSNVITYTPETTEGNCTQGQAYPRNVFHTGGGDDTCIDPDGGTINAIGDSQNTTENPFWAYFKIGGGTQNCKSPADACTLTNPIVVSGDRSGTIVVNFDNKIDGTQNPCDMSAPIFSFR